MELCGLDGETRHWMNESSERATTPHSVAFASRIVHHCLRNKKKKMENEREIEKEGECCRN